MTGGFGHGRPTTALIVDDRPNGLTALAKAIEHRYSSDYRIAAYTSASAALADLKLARDHGDEVALVIADQWMPEMMGGELLHRAHALHPGAQRALLVGWGDNRANESILQGCARGQLDNYVLKPWAPAEVHLYPLIGEFLAEWTRQHRPRMELIRLIGAKHSPRSRELLNLLERNGVPHGYYEAESQAGRELMTRMGVDRTRLPALVLIDGRVMHDPTTIILRRSLACRISVIRIATSRSSAPDRAGSRPR